MTLKVLYIGLPTTFLGGAETRSFNTLKCYPNFSIDVYLYVPITYLMYYYNALFSDQQRRMLLEQLSFLQKCGIFIDNNVFELLENVEKMHVLIDRKRNLRILLNPSVSRSLPAITLVKNVIEYERDFLKKFLSDVRRIDIVYSSLSESIYILSSGLYAKHIIQNAIHVTLLHQALYTITSRLEPEPLRSLKLLDSGFVERIGLFLSPKIRKLLTWPSYKLYIPFNYEELYRWSFKRELLDAVFVISKEPLNYVSFDKINVPIYTLRPGNAFETNILRFRNTSSKKSYAVYYARLIPEKGVLEIPLIWFLVSRFRPTRLVVAGRFFDSKTRSVLEKLLKIFELEDYVDYAGFVQNKEDLYRLVANAKVLVYPSHSDGFSLVVLEALILGTSVVAYDIPALSDIYGSLPPVKLVPEGDIRSAAVNTIKILDEDIDDYNKEHEDPRVKQFIELHNGWEKVAIAEISLFDKILK